MVMFSPASTNVNVTKDSDYVFRNIFTDDFRGQLTTIHVAMVKDAKFVAAPKQLPLEEAGQTSVTASQAMTTKAEAAQTTAP